ncbi:hypothetical protein [Fibrobacter sp. UWB11]|uniref:hypothetical protein n=1 Tax=Fibrobacter sp. UWB11 TaxID=1896202 RepID=UPI00092A1CEF|nr:hypothetical protein [Fibrobacter sp. UWB11]SIO05662.1 hypothetical protein SAMN05720758_1206 [Fibrobacter sp. UWB11]
MLEIFKIVLEDVANYGLNIFAPCVLALILTLLYKKNKHKKICKILLWVIPLIIICKLRFLSSYTYAYTIAIFLIFAILYAATIAIGKRFAENKIVLCLSVPFILACSYLFLAVFEYIDSRETFGSVEDRPLPDHTKSNHDYTIRINYADAWGNNNYTMTIRGKNATDVQADSIIFCKQVRLCAGAKFTTKDSASRDTQKVLPTERIRCQWELFPNDKKANLFKFKELAENYTKEYKIGFVLDGYTFSVDMIDYNKKTVRNLSLDNATNYEDQVPKAKEIVNLGLNLIDFNDSIKVDKKCNEHLPQMSTSFGVDSTSLNTNDTGTALIKLDEIKKPKRRKPTKK